MTVEFLPPTDRVMSACRKGELSETLLIAGALVHGWEIFTPFGHAQTADLVLVRLGSRPLTVQIKTASRSPRGDYTLNVRRGKGTTVRPYAHGDFDILAAYLPDRNQFVFWTLNDIRSRLTVRYHPDKHRSPGNWHLLDEVALLPTPRTAPVPPPTVQMSTYL